MDPPSRAGAGVNQSHYTALSLKGDTATLSIDFKDCSKDCIPQESLSRLGDNASHLKPPVILPWRDLFRLPPPPPLVPSPSSSLIPTQNVRDSTTPRSAAELYGLPAVEYARDEFRKLASLQACELVDEIVDLYYAKAKCTDPKTMKQCIIKSVSSKMKLINKCTVIERVTALRIIDSIEERNHQHVQEPSDDWFFVILEKLNALLASCDGEAERERVLQALEVWRQRFGGGWMDGAMEKLMGGAAGVKIRER
ncbi:hypothetical protein HDU98_008245 [Podochytrium sp. JEL0797]|nr:hypothetical protein HDU98_008245 [Podochytrium sp. JEL0797]